jgi:hypothetical protein
MIKTSSLTATLLGLACASLLITCGGGAGTSSTPRARIPEAVRAQWPLPAGLWRGPIVNARGESVLGVALVMEDGEAMIMSRFGYLVMTLNRGLGQGRTVTQPDALQYDWISKHPLEVEVTEAVARRSFKGQYTTAGIGSNSGTFDLEYLPEVDQPMAMVDLARGWQSRAMKNATINNLAWTVDASGAITGELPGHIEVSGQLTVPDANRKLFKVSLSYRDRHGRDQTLKGLGTLGQSDDGFQPKLQLFAVSDDVVFWGEFLPG